MSDTTLIVVLDPEPLVLLEGPDFDVPCVLDGREFRDADLGPIVGHYDWLHTSDGNLIGIRTQPFQQSGLGQIVTRLVQHPSVEISGPYFEFSLYLTPVREFDPDLSLDAEFDVNRILIDDDGTFALTYKTACRSDSEMTAITQWVQDSSSRRAGK